MDKDPIEPKKNYLWIYILIIIAAAIVFWTVCVEEVKVPSRAQLQPRTSVSNVGIGYSSARVKREIIINAKFFEVTPAPDPSDTQTFGIGMHLRSNQTIVKEFGERKMIVHHIGNHTTIEWVKRFVQEAKLDIPNANYMKITGINYVTKTEGFGIGMSSTLPMPFDNVKEVSK